MRDWIYLLLTIMNTEVAQRDKNRGFKLGVKWSKENSTNHIIQMKKYNGLGGIEMPFLQD